MREIMHMHTRFCILRIRAAIRMNFVRSINVQLRCIAVVQGKVGTGEVTGEMIRK